MKLRSRYMGWLATLAIAGAVMPSHAATEVFEGAGGLYDMTVADSFMKLSYIGLPTANAIFTNVLPNDPSGTGVFKPIVRIDAHGTEEGYNTSARPTQYDEQTAGNWTRNITRDEIYLMDHSQFAVLPTLPGGLKYREFALDANQNNGNSFIELTKMQIFLSSTQSFAGPIGSDPNAVKVFDLDLEADGVTVHDRTIKIDTALAGSGSGRIDLLAYFPQALSVTGKDYVYLYSEFTGANDGYEEWALRVPAPPAILGGLFAFASLGRLRRRISAAKADAAAA